MSLLDKLVEKTAGADWFAKVAPKFVPKIDRFFARISGGRFTMTGLYSPALVLTTIGRKSGEPRTVPLACFPRGDDLVLVGSNFGRENHPAWSLNLIANPEATVTYCGKTFPVKAHVADEAERAELWAMITKKMPHFDKYTARSGRHIRVFVLRRA